MKMKCLRVPVAILFIIALSGCISTGPPAKREEKEPEPEPASAANIEEKLNIYNFNVLRKIDQELLPKYVIAVIGDATQIEEAKLELGELIATAVNASGRVTMVDRKSLDKIIEEQKLALQGITEENGMRLGELAGADYLIMSSIVSSSAQKEDKVVYDIMVVKVKAQLKLLDVSSGEVSLSLEGEGETKTKLVTDSSGKLVSGAVDYNNLYAEATQKAIKDMIPEFIRKFPAIGFMLKVGDEEITCDLGSSNGVQENAFVAFIRKGEANYHPVTKKLVSIDYEYLGYGNVVQVKSSTSTVKIQEGVGEIEASDLAVFVD